MRIRRHYYPPALIVPAMIIRQQRATMIKQQHAAQHVTVALIADDIWTSPLISNGNAKMMIIKAPVVRHTRLRPGKHKNPRLSIAPDFITGEGRPTFRAIQHDTGQNPFHRATVGNHAGAIQNVDGRMLIAPHITKCDSGNSPPGDKKSGLDHSQRLSAAEIDPRKRFYLHRFPVVRRSDRALPHLEERYLEGDNSEDPLHRQAASWHQMDWRVAAQPCFVPLLPPAIEGAA